jgi:hypothetical protein
LNLTSLSTNLVENPNVTIIENVVQKTEEINILESSSITLMGLSLIEFLEKIIKFFIYFNLNSLFAGSKVLKFPVELTSRRVLRVLETKVAICQLVDDEGRGDIYTYLCEVEIASNQTIKNVKIVNAFEFSSQNYSVSSGVSVSIEQYLDNILEIGNKFDYLLNSTLYTLKNSKIELGEKPVFNISGIINDPKPKFGKVDLNLSVFAEYEDKKEEKQIECSIIDIIENNYILNCIGMKNTNINLKNAISVIENEILLIDFGENENTLIIYSPDENENTQTIYSSDENENKTNYSMKSINKKSGKIGVGAIIAIVLACLVAVAAVIIFIIYFKKRDKQIDSAPDSTVANLKI